MSRILGLDVGDVRIGVAVSDELHLIATPHSVYRRVGWGPDVKHLMALYRELSCDLCVCGLPRNMDGTVGFQAEKVMQFAELLEKAGMNLVFQDERLTTVTATDALIEGGMRREKRKDTVDKVAAAVILQSYLDSGK